MQLESSQIDRLRKNKVKVPMILVALVCLFFKLLSKLKKAAIEIFVFASILLIKPVNRILIETMNGSNTQRVGEIFKTAGQAFTTLGQLTSQLESSGQNTTKWTDQVLVFHERKINTRKYLEGPQLGFFSGY